MKLDGLKSDGDARCSRRPAVRAEVERGEVGGAGDADLLVGFGGAALGGGDVGAALEELRGKAGRDVRAARLSSGSGEAGRLSDAGGLADEDGDGVLVLRALRWRRRRPATLAAWSWVWAWVTSDLAAMPPR